jgi:hypothetical protein
MLNLGELNPILGWYSGSFLSKVPNKVLKQTFELKKQLEIKSTVIIHW